MKRVLTSLLCLVLSLSMIIPVLGEASVENTEEQSEYSQWFSLAYAAVYSQWVHTTWIVGYSDYSETDLNFLLKSDPFTWSQEELTAKAEITRDDPNKALMHMYQFLNTAKSTLEPVKESHAAITIPDEYTAIDAMMMDTIDTLLNLRNSFETHIQTKKYFDSSSIMEAEYTPIDSWTLKKYIGLFSFIMGL